MSRLPIRPPGRSSCARRGQDGRAAHPASPAGVGGRRLGARHPADHAQPLARSSRAALGRDLLDPRGARLGSDRHGHPGEHHLARRRRERGEARGRRRVRVEGRRQVRRRSRGAPARRAPSRIRRAFARSIAARPAGAMRPAAISRSTPRLVGGRPAAPRLALGEVELAAILVDAAGRPVDPAEARAPPRRPPRSPGPRVRSGRATCTSQAPR